MNRMNKSFVLVKCGKLHRHYMQWCNTEFEYCNCLSFTRPQTIPKHSSVPQESFLAPLHSYDFEPSLSWFQEILGLELTRTCLHLMCKLVMTEQIQIPIPCPKCGERMLAIRYDPPLKVLKDRGWHTCTSCNYEQTVDEFKKTLFFV